MHADVISVSHPVSSAQHPRSAPDGPAPRTRDVVAPPLVCRLSDNNGRVSSPIVYGYGLSRLAPFLTASGSTEVREALWA
jgi:hypothetical protein